jgi:hypothetical protein
LDGCRERDRTGQVKSKNVENPHKEVLPQDSTPAAMSLYPKNLQMLSMVSSRKLKSAPAIKNVVIHNRSGSRQKKSKPSRDLMLLFV